MREPGRLGNRASTSSNCFRPSVSGNALIHPLPGARLKRMYLVGCAKDLMHDTTITALAAMTMSFIGRAMGSALG